MAPSHIFQIFLRVTVQDQICIAQWVIVDEVVQFRLLRHSHIQCILDPSAKVGHRGQQDTSAAQGTKRMLEAAGGGRRCCCSSPLIRTKKKRHTNVCSPVDIPTGWEPRTKQQPTGLLLTLLRRALRVAFADFSAAPWQGFEKSERCPNNSSLFLPQAAVIVVAVQVLLSAQKKKRHTNVCLFLVQ